MLTIERHNTILRLLEIHEIVTLQMLVDETHCSESTIRRDLSTLESEGQLIRIHGGAKKVTEKHRDIALSVKSTKKTKEKEEIAKVAAAQVRNNDCIYLDAGSSTLMMIPYLDQAHITIVTNGLTHVPPLVEKGYEVYMIGGYIKPDTHASIGVQAIENLKQFRFDKAFMGANGVHLTQGITTPDIEEAYVKRKAIEKAEQVYFLVDDSKFDEVTFAKVLDMQEGRTMLITNRENNLQHRYSKYLI